MRAGKMRQLVDIYNPTASTEDDGQELYTYSLYLAGVFAELVDDVFGKDEAGFIQASGHSRATLRMRFDDGITYVSRLEWQGKTWRVVEVDNRFNLRHELVIVVEAVDL